ncbi:3-oxoacyl-[acyl-carrier protein] reductase [Bacillus ectoiniformans]|uniref:elongation factor P 5-aminopentanone reductase n=1 Tax=Bacillus ectoiniformans TaxID=1494429 RepID=UPI00195B14CD|nr:SDR family oxidoreductase [Bacillus ectoiniformans]MBM7650071.1 3-oxoacyl-[acyl-carrier protein] reductase [Bacillus ectoiniformans]
MSKYVLITGASGGIGQETARKFAEKGWNLYLQYYSGEERIQDLKNELEKKGAEVIAIQADLTSFNGPDVLMNSIFSVQAAVFAGGTAHYGLFQDTSAEEMDRLWELHVKGPMRIVQKLIAKFQMEDQAAIVFISSIWGQTGASCEVVYSAVKGAQIALTKALAKELAPSNIRVNAVAPGAVDTPMLSGFSEEELHELAGDIPMGRLAKPEEIANAVSYLCSKDSSYITGQIIGVNGGWHT